MNSNNREEEKLNKFLSASDEQLLLHTDVARETSDSNLAKAVLQHRLNKNVEKLSKSNEAYSSTLILLTVFLIFIGVVQVSLGFHMPIRLFGILPDVVASCFITSIYLLLIKKAGGAGLKWNLATIAILVIVPVLSIYFIFTHQPKLSTGIEATLNTSSIEVSITGNVFPNNADTVAWFEYGTTTLNLKTPDQDVGSGIATIPISTTLTGLIPNTAYYYRAVAKNIYGENYGKTESFIAP